MGNFFSSTPVGLPSYFEQGDPLPLFEPEDPLPPFEPEDPLPPIEPEDPFPPFEHPNSVALPNVEPAVGLEPEGGPQRQDRERHRYNPALGLDVAEQFELWATQKKWGQGEKAYADQFAEDLRAIIRAGIPEGQIRNDNEEVLRRALANPSEFGRLGKRIMDEDFLNTTLKFKQLSRSTTAKDMDRLGLVRKHIYRESDILEAANKPEFQALHACQPIPDALINKVNRSLAPEKFSVNLTHSDASTMINKHICSLQSSYCRGVLISELVLAKLDANDQAVKLTNVNKDTTYMTGKTDIGVITLTSLDENDLPTAELPRLAELSLTQDVLRGTFQTSGGRSYAEITNTTTKLLKPFHNNVSSEVTFFEAKRPSWTFDVAPGVVHLKKKKNLVKQSSAVNQILSFCRGAGSQGHELMKFGVADGRMWIFGILNNETNETHYTSVLNNTNLDRTRDVLRLLSLWLILPERLLHDELFEKIRPYKSVDFNIPRA